jgi:hypothetical protein
LVESAHQDSSFEQDGALIERRTPVPNRHCPPLADIFQSQVHQLEHRLIVREQRAILAHFAQCPVQRLYRVGRVDSPPDLRWVGEHRDDSRPVLPLRPGNDRVRHVPGLLELRKLALSLFHSRRLIGVYARTDTLSSCIK